jgi:hypothetical protein
MIIGKDITMKLNVNEINNYLRNYFDRYEDSMQQAWLEIVERDPQTIEDITPIARKIKNKAIRHYLHKKFREQSLYEPLGRGGDGGFTLESILACPIPENEGTIDNGGSTIYMKIVDFLIAQYLSQKEEIIAFKKQKMEQKAQRIRVREEELKFKRERFESWKKLMENKGKEKESRLRLKIQIQRERFEFRKEQFSLRGNRGISGDDDNGSRLPNGRAASAKAAWIE